MMIRNEVVFMKKQGFLHILRLFLAPVLMILLGILLVMNPDSASALVSGILGWILTGVGIVSAVTALLADRNRIGRLMTAAVLLVCGSVLWSRPLLLAYYTGRLVGLLLLLDGLADLFAARRAGVRGLMPLIVAILGGVLILMPMSASRIVFRLCGLAVVLIGCAMLFDRIRRPRLNRGHDKPDIIDAL